MIDRWSADDSDSGALLFAALSAVCSGRLAAERFDCLLAGRENDSQPAPLVDRLFVSG